VLRAPIVLRATEGFTSRMRGLRRRWLPMNSAMIATDPLPESLWRTIGWEGRETLGDLAHGFFYAQRTADDRIAIGGRAVPYRYASRIDHDGAVGQRTIDYLAGVLSTVLPQTRGVPIAHGWCGVLAVPRDWTAGVAFDPANGLGEAGGYVGHGVTATNLAGRTLADLVLKRSTALTELPWVDHRSRTWEPEPLRWLGVQGLYSAYKLADRHEAGAGGLGGGGGHEQGAERGNPAGRHGQILCGSGQGGPRRRWAGGGGHHQGGQAQADALARRQGGGGDRLGAQGAGEEAGIGRRL
jgi:hypothetical protein